jgi:hypothetical protein
MLWSAGQLTFQQTDRIHTDARAGGQFCLGQPRIAAGASQ